MPPIDPQSLWQKLAATEPFAIHSFPGWAWAVLAVLLYPFRHLFTRWTENLSLSLETQLISKGYLDSLAILSLRPRHLGGGPKGFSIQGSIIVVNLRTVSNVVLEAPQMIADGAEITVDWKEKFPLALGSRAAHTIAFAEYKDIALPPSGKASIKVIIKDVYGRTYESTVDYAPAH